MKVHRLLVKSKYYCKIADECFPYNIEKDEGFEIGDILILHEVENEHETGRLCTAFIEEIFEMKSILPEYITMKIQVLGKFKK